MLWFSERKGSDDRPALLALGVRRVGRVLRCEMLYVGEQLEPGEVPGVLLLGESDAGSPMTVDFPKLPWGGRNGRLHPAEKWTPERYIHRDSYGIDYIDLRIVEGDQHEQPEEGHT